MPWTACPKSPKTRLPPNRALSTSIPWSQNGTYWYHSHSGLQEQLGVAGPLIVEPKDEPLDYDRDYVIILADWLHSDPHDIIPMLRKESSSEGMNMEMDQRRPDLADVDYPASC